MRRAPEWRQSELHHHPLHPQLHHSPHHSCSVRFECCLLSTLWMNRGRSALLPQLHSPLVVAARPLRSPFPHPVAHSAAAAMSTSTPPPSHNAQLRALLHSIIPPLSPSSHKGQAGRVCVIGGSSAYTGAPYFSAMTTLKLGCDLVTVLCSIDAALPIKSYSPELMTRPTLIPSHLLTTPGAHPLTSPTSTPLTTIPRIVADCQRDVLSRTNVLIVGPGLGKDDLLITDTVAGLLLSARTSSPTPVPLIIDGDAITSIACSPQHSHIIIGYSQCIVTPNAAEFRRLWDAHLPHTPPPPMSLPVDQPLIDFMTQNREEEGGWIEVDHPFASHVAQLARAMGGVTVVRKGPIDVASDGCRAVYCCREGAPRRCGGQGDVLTGAIGTVLAWAGIHRTGQKEGGGKGKGEGKGKVEGGAEGKREGTGGKDQKGGDGGQERKESSAMPDDAHAVYADAGEVSGELLAAYAGSLLVRRSAELAFKAHGRSMLASHVMDGMEQVIEELAPVRSKI